MTQNAFYADTLMEEWGANNQSARFRSEVKKVLMELSPGAQLILRNEPRLQVEIGAGGAEWVWAYSPVYGRRLIAQRFTLKPKARILLVLRSQMFEDGSSRKILSGSDCLRDHLGHTLLYLRRPKARNECVDAAREWKDCCS